MCEFTGLRQASIRELLVAIDADVQDTETDGLGLLSVTEFPSLESVANGCPACMLCAVRIAETVNDLAVGFMLDYKYRQAEFWKAFRIKNQLSEIY